MPRSWLTETIAQVDGLINQIDALPDEVRMYLFDRLFPEPEPEPEAKPTKKTRKKSPSKSKRASGLGNAISNSLRQSKAASNGNDEIDQCLFVLNATTGETCNAVKDNPIHDLTYSSSHVYVTHPPRTKIRCQQKGCGAWSINPIHDPSFGHDHYHAFVPASTRQSAAVSGGD